MTQTNTQTNTCAYTTSPLCPSLVRIYTKRPLPHPKSAKVCLPVMQGCFLRSSSHSRIRYAAIAMSSNTNFDGSVISVQPCEKWNRFYFLDCVLHHSATTLCLCVCVCVCVCLCLFVSACCGSEMGKYKLANELSENKKKTHFNKGTAIFGFKLCVFSSKCSRRNNMRAVFAHTCALGLFLSHMSGTREGI